MNATSDKAAPPSSVTDAVLVPSNEMPEGSQKVEELDFNKFVGRPITVDDLISGMNHMGFQASSIGEAVRIINDMVSPLPLPLPHSSSLQFPTSLLTPFLPLLPSTSSKSNNITESMARPRNLGPHHNLPRLHLEPNLLRPARDPPLPRPTLSHLSNRNHSRRHRRRPHKMSRRHLHRFFLHSRRRTPLKRSQSNRKPHCSQ